MAMEQNEQLILEDGRPEIFWVYDAIFTLPISNHAKVVYCNLCRRANKEGRSFPSYSTIARDCDISRSSAIRAINQLVAFNTISKESQKVEREQTENIYRILALNKWYKSGNSSEKTGISTLYGGKKSISNDYGELQGGGGVSLTPPSVTLTSKGIRETNTRETFPYSEADTLNASSMPPTWIPKGKEKREIFNKLRAGIYREVLFSQYDNLLNMPIEKLVGESATKGIEYSLRHNDRFIRKNFSPINLKDFPVEVFVGEVIRHFPYHKLPPPADGRPRPGVAADKMTRDELRFYKRRDFFVAALCNTVAGVLADCLSQAKGRRYGCYDTS